MTAVYVIIGAVMFWVAVFAAGATAIVFAFVWFYGPFGPMLHCGAPQLECKLSFYSRQRLLAKKGGGRFTETELAALPPRLDHSFNVPWFAGVSTRKGHFLFGFIRLKRQVST